MAKKERILYYDITLCICIFASFLVHTSTHFYDVSQTLWWEIFVTGSAALIFMSVGAKILPLHESGCQFLKRRFKKIVPAFIFWSIIYIACEHFVVHNPNYLWLRQIAWIAYSPAFSPAWFIYTLLGIYLIAPIISPWIKTASKRSIEYFLLIWLIAGLQPFAHEYVVFSDQASIFAAFATYPGYAIAGYYLAKWPMAERAQKERYLFYSIMFVIGVLCSLKLAQLALRYGWVNVPRDDRSLTVMAFTLLEFSVLQHIKRVPKALQFIIDLVTRNSLHIYLCHYAIIMFILLPMHLSFTTTLCIATLASIAVGWVFTRIDSFITRILNNHKI